MIKKVVFILMVLLYINNVNALCIKEELNLLKEKANKIEILNEYKIEEINDYLSDNIKYANYTLKAYNLSNDLNVFVEYNKETRKFDNKKGSDVLNNFYSGNVKIKIKANTNNCQDNLLRTINLNLAYYNQFYNSDKCLEYREFEYCKSEFLDEDVSNITFNKKLNEYINYLEKEEINEEEKEIKDKKENKVIIYIILSIVIIIFIALLAIYQIRKNIKKREL